MPTVGALTILGLGLVLGFKHATEVDHVVAVSTIVSEHRSIWRPSLVGALWGVGHTVSLLVTGVILLVFRVAIPSAVAAWLELGVALMIIGLGSLAFVRAIRRDPEVHFHRHNHNGQSHIHVHFHEGGTEHEGHTESHSHAVSQLGLKPFIVGSVHGLAGSAALTLLLLPQIESPLVGLLYLLVFGLGSIGGMLAISTLVGLPFAVADRGVARAHRLQTFAGALSVIFGLWYFYKLSTG